MFTVSRQFSFCYGHRLLNHPGKCANLHGHNAKVSIVLRHNTLNEQGMIADFGDIKKSIGLWIETRLDHRLILETHDPLIPVLKDQGLLIFPLPAEPTAENLAKLLYEETEKTGLPVCSVTFWETEHCSAEYRA
ncbi:MAG: 6-carboxytetrahydropterin synthase [Planctomycetaceae bacterium]|jgi:6-pyruvoyltetrahydropterin/6-carboxytetrahydropterin synthase|nr:6-carboxytetrahydropterin synthase [Planctomycetaceae bacterium]